jgi:hypothetical protein
MKIKIVNPDGNPNRSDVVNAETGEVLEYVTDVQIRASRENLEAIVTFIIVPVDLVAHVEGVRLNDEYACLQIDKRTHEVLIQKETEDSVEIAIRRKV